MPTMHEKYLQVLEKYAKFEGTGLDTTGMIARELASTPEWAKWAEEARAIARLEWEKQFTPELERRKESLRRVPGHSELLMYQYQILRSIDADHGIFDQGAPPWW